ncbi:alpha/beta hydrolase [Yinghuangia seranimata]|uniref:alpha/beta hydrolase n=1 Tax=Yinghuangia seranimata TaxID=408067 RepID=UPI00248ADF9A|nr:alpha/beta hydrolase [Yinghuangia seranimata]MDI2126032.1 alpha/beta hydrolase [Yinghuangia seranimata]
MVTTHTVTTHTVTSADGTTIAYDRYTPADESQGTVILVGGAFSYRSFPKMVELAEALTAAYALTVVNYDRRGRGDSGDTPGRYDVAQEADDLAALIAAEGGAAALFGWSSGAVVALRAAGSGRVPGITRVIAFEPPFVVDRTRHVPPADLATTLHELVAAGERAKTAKFYMTKAIGLPAAFVALLRITPMWSKLTATALSTPHDWAAVADYMRGEPLDPADWEGVTAPVLVLSGARSEPLLRTAARAAADVLPDARLTEIAKLSHNPNVPLLVAPAGEFLTEQPARTA